MENQSKKVSEIVELLSAKGRYSKVPVEEMLIVQSFGRCRDDNTRSKGIENENPKIDVEDMGMSIEGTT